MRLADLRAPLVVLASAASAATVALPASAAIAQAQVPTQIVLTAAPNPISGPSIEVTISGVLETTGQASQPIARQSVSLTLWGTEQWFITDATGAFSEQQQVPALGVVTANFAGTAAYGPASASVRLTGTQGLPTRLKLNPIAPAAPLSQTVVTGTVQIQESGGTWAPASFAAVRDACPTPGSATADASGRFILPVEADPGAACTVTVSGEQAGPVWDTWYEDAVSGQVTVPLSTYPVWLCGTSGPTVSPSPVGTIGLATRACYQDSAGGVHPYPDAAIDLYFLAPRSGHWRLMARSSTAADGSAQVTVSGYLPGGGLAAGRWRFVIPAAGHYLGTGAKSPGFGVTITVPATLSRPAISRSGGRIALRGRLGYPRNGTISGATVTIERYRSGRWHAVGTTRTSARGWFRFRLAARATGRYRASYAGGPLPGAQAAYGSFLPAVGAAVRLR